MVILKEESCSAEDLVRQCWFWAKHVAHSSLWDSLQRTDSSPVNTWISPPTGWVKLNADGAVAMTNP